ncbi:MAG: hypothetical protein M1570_01100 [Chloroflexi bacterium]|nr:hypothetical protein [Chloroflexota bacterium]
MKTTTRKRSSTRWQIVGIPIRIEYSLILILAVLTWVCATAYYPREIGRDSAVVYWFLAALTALMYLMSVALHELAHGVAVQQYGVAVRSITLSALGDVPDMTRAARARRDEFVIAMAGPTVNLVLAALFAVIEVTSSALLPLAILAKSLAVINASLALLNLIPFLPLDGGLLLRLIGRSVAADPNRVGRAVALLGGVIGLGLILSGFWRMLNHDLDGLWLTLVGYLLLKAARRETRQLELPRHLESISGSSATSLGHIDVQAEATLRSLVDRYLADFKARTFFVQRDGEIVGVLTWYHINLVPRADWDSTTAEEAMSPTSRFESVSRPREREGWQGLGTTSRPTVLR